MHSEILRLLKGRNNYISGEKISGELGITRAAVWKKITSLRKQGFTIRAVPSKGYTLIKSPDFSISEINAGINRDFWKEVLYFSHLSSTNEFAMAMSLKKKPVSASVVIAEMQNKGRGRLGRTWISPPGVNIYMSIILKPELEPKDAHILTVLASLAASTAIRKQCGLEVLIKWPNDLTVSGRKLGGILTEIRSDPDEIGVAVIGIGINVNQAGPDFAREIRSSATSIRCEKSLAWSRSLIVSGILNEFEYWYKILTARGKFHVLPEWKKLSSTIGKKIKVTIGNEVISGLAEAINDDGMLMVRVAGGDLRRVSSGDLTMLR